MTSVVNTAALLITVVALVSAGATLLATRSVGVALPVLLDLLLAVTLLRLALHPSPAQVLGTALLVLIKRFLSTGIEQATLSRLTAPAPRRLRPGPPEVHGG